MNFFSLQRNLQVFVLVTLITGISSLSGQVIREYNVKKTSGSLTIDGMLTEQDWEQSTLTEPFVIYFNGAATNLNTQSKFLWDDEYLYIGFICEDPDVWAILENRDDHLWNGEVVEILCDPNGDGLDYFEVQVNPLGTILDLLMTKAYYLGGSADLSWNLDSIKAGVWIQGTINNYAEPDTMWTCEVALPFAELAFMAPNQNFPPQQGDEWRMLTTRYDYPRDGSQVFDPEVSSWNQTQSQGGFHVPTKFGRLVFSVETAVSINTSDKQLQPVDFYTIENYPNPFNPAATIKYHLSKSAHVKIQVIDILGRHIRTLVDREIQAGSHFTRWDGRCRSNKKAASGVYFLVMCAGEITKVRKMVFSG